MNLETRKPGVEIQDKELTERSVTFLASWFSSLLNYPCWEKPGCLEYFHSA